MSTCNVQVAAFRAWLDGRPAGAGRRRWQPAYFLGSLLVLWPSASVSCCAQVAAFRAWLDGRGGGGPTPLAAGPLPPELQSKEQMLDRYNQHTRFCPSCSQV